MHSGRGSWQSQVGLYNLLNQKYFYGKKLNPMSILKIRWGLSPIDPPFPPPMGKRFSFCYHFYLNAAKLKYGTANSVSFFTFLCDIAISYI